MKKRKNTVLVLLMSSLVFFISTMTIIAGKAGISHFAFGIADNYEVVVTNEMLMKKENWFEDFVVDGHTDKKFRINLDNEKYILGAVLFNKYRSHSVGGSLNDILLMDNLNYSFGNSFCINIVFSFKNIEKVIVDQTIQSSTKSGVEDSSTENLGVRIKYAHFNCGNSDDDFYNEIANSGYDAITSNNIDDGYYGEIGETNYVLTPNPTEMIGDTRFEYSSIGGNYNLVSISYDSGDPINAGRNMLVLINSITFSYTCS